VVAPAAGRFGEQGTPAQLPGPPARIVTGVDGSPASLAALRWAIGQAELTGAAVDAVIAWHFPVLGASGGFGIEFAAMGPGDFRKTAENSVAEVVSGALGPASDVRVRVRAVEGDPARSLLDASAGADLLVVGSRGHGGLAGALLGSVSEYCVRHAACPVVVTRGQAPS
jgi:nucleotide-binding universal stress UspA family protein